MFSSQAPSMLYSIQPITILRTKPLESNITSGSERKKNPMFPFLGSDCALPCLRLDKIRSPSFAAAMLFNPVFCKYIWHHPPQNKPLPVFDSTT